MYELKRLISRHIEENIIKYILVLSIFAAGIAFGFFMSNNVSTDLSDGLKQEIGNLMNNFSGGNFDRVQIVKTSFLRNLRIAVLIFISGLAAWLAVVSFGTLFCYGFSIGFTIGYLSVCFGGRGMFIALVSLAGAFLINIPVYIILSVISFNNGRRNRHGHSNERNYGTYSVIFILLFLPTILCTATDAFIVPSLIGLICS